MPESPDLPTRTLIWGTRGWTDDEAEQVRQWVAAVEAAGLPEVKE